MRVISGSARGRKLSAPEGLDTRPTTDRVKESVFNIIRPYLPAKSVLDLFAGSGALGIEALSRGSSSAIFVDLSKSALSIIRENLMLTRLADRASVIQDNSIAFLEHTKDTFDIIFLDPPYNKGLMSTAVSAIEKNSLLRKNGIIVVESEYRGEEPPPSGFETIKRVKYGKTEIYILKNV